MSACPQCGRPVAVAGPRCLYCGAGLPAEAVAASEAARNEVERRGPERLLLILDVTGAEPTALSLALGESLYEAGQRARRGGYQLLRVTEASEARMESERLAGLGIAVILIPEAEVRAALPPVRADRGALSDVGLDLRTEEGRLRITASDLTLIVKGPLVREYPPSSEFKRVRTATLEPGYRFHLHRRAQPRPLELDPGDFDFGGATSSTSSFLQLTGWVQAVAAGVPEDDGFRRLPPALAPANPPTGMTAALGAERGGRRGAKAGQPDARALLDNLGQFRFYSAWRGTLERHLSR